MGKQYLVDTNIAVGYLENQLPLQWIIELNKITIQLSIIIRIELLAWPDATQHKLQILHAFIDSSITYNLDEFIIIETIKVRKFYKIKLPDAIIAATALVNNQTLLTLNTSDFKKVTGLDIVNPFQI